MSDWTTLGIVIACLVIHVRVLLPGLKEAGEEEKARSLAWFLAILLDFSIVMVVAFG